jgi:hypothetical protein
MLFVPPLNVPLPSNIIPVARAMELVCTVSLNAFWLKIPEKVERNSK